MFKKCRQIECRVVRAVEVFAAAIDPVARAVAGQIAGGSGAGSGYLQETAQKLGRTKPASTLIITLSLRFAQSVHVTRVRASQVQPTPCAAL